MILREVEKMVYMRRINERSVINDIYIYIPVVKNGDDSLKILLKPISKKYCCGIAPKPTTKTYANVGLFVKYSTSACLIQLSKWRILEMP